MLCEASEVCEVSEVCEASEVSRVLSGPDFQCYAGFKWLVVEWTRSLRDGCNARHIERVISHHSQNL